jgi:phenylacetaldehyde dehydrogenase
MSVVREEIFGPVVCVQSFDDSDLDRVAKFANDTEYGLQASVWTCNLTVAHMMARKIKAGTICVNTIITAIRLAFRRIQAIRLVAMSEAN